MSKRTAYELPQPSLRDSVLVTIFAVVLPVVLLLRLMALKPHMPTLVAVAAGFALIVTASVLARVIWRKTLERHRIQVVDLFVWSWARRRHVERRLYDKVAALGLLDNLGAPQLPRRRRLELLTQLTKALESSDPYTHGHSRRVARHAYRTALTMALSPNQIETLKRAAQLHDVGKLDVPVAVMQKTSSLTPEERALMEQHSVYGAEMVSVLQDQELLAGVLHHHERWDGAGYPDGLRETEIPLAARIIAVADAFDAITSERPYRSAESRRRAIEIVRSQRGSQFDPEVTDAFLAALPRIPMAIASLGILAIPFKALSRLLEWVRGMGRDYAPAAAAVGIAVIVGAGAATLPPLKQAPPALASSDGTAAPAGSGTSGGTQVKGKRITKKDVKVKSNSATPDTTTTVPATPTPLPTASPQQQNPPGHITQPQPTPSPGPGSGPEPGPSPGPNHQPSPGPTPHPTPADPGVTVGPPGNASHCAAGDPQPDRGKDCRRPGKKGHAKASKKHGR
ncbi:MAG: hypothetical protein QOH26_558 [Actinomycetota bacterium]|nr:hypothetical protein [Actinomycetota bacterium]